MSDLAAVGLIALLWVALFLAACVHDLRINRDWPDLPWPTRILYTIRDTGDPQRYVHMFYGECHRDWCWCHDDSKQKERARNPIEPPRLWGKQ